MGKTSYQSILEIVNQIKSKIELLNNGQLNVKELEKLTQNSRELFERLIVLRHKAFENFTEEEKNIVEDNLQFEKPILEEPQIEIKTNPIQSESIDPIEENMMFDFSEPLDLIEETVKESIPKEVEKEIIDENRSEDKIVDDIESSTLNETFSDSTASLNDAFKSKTSLADKLTNSKLSDLKSAIDINKKFAFISDLFNGSNENYNEALNALNSCGSADKAKELLNDLSNQNNWDVENSTVEKFVEIIERRY